MAGLSLDSIYEDEDAAERKPVLKTTSQENAPSADVGGAIAPPAAASTAPAAVSSRPPTVEQAAKEGGKVVKDVFGYLNPVHLKEGVKEYKTYEDVDPYATGAHAIADLTALYGLKKIGQGVGEGVSSRISNMIKGIDPTIKAQIQQSDKALQMKYGQQQGKLNPVATPVGRVEPTFSPELFAPQAEPVAPTSKVAPTAVAPTEPAPVAEKPIEPVKPTPQEEIQQLKLKQEQIKTDRLEREHQNWISKNTLSESEQAFGRKAKDAAELTLMDTAYKQQQQKASSFNQGPALKSELPSTQPSFTTKTEAPNVTTSLPAVQQQAVAPAPVQPANVVSTGPTPEAAAAPIEKAAEVKEVTTPKKAKTEPKIPKPEFFKNAPSAERWMYGSMTKYMDQPASAQAVVARAADYLPEGTKFEMQPGGEGGGIHPEQKQHLNRFVSEQLGVPLKDGKLPEDFKFTTENRNKLAASVQSELEQHAKAGTLGKLGKGALAAAALLGITEAVQAAQKGDYGPLREAGFNIGGPITASAVGLTALSKAAGVPFSLATYSGGLNEGEEKELAYRRKVGAGRGIAPPSAYLR